MIRIVVGLDVGDGGGRWGVHIIPCAIHTEIT